MDDVRRIRKEHGLSQQRLSELAGVDKVTIVHIETGKVSPKVETLAKLADALGVEVADFFPKAQAPLFAEDALTNGAAHIIDDLQAAVRSAVEEAASDWRALAEDATSPAQVVAVVGVVDREAGRWWRMILSLMEAADRALPPAEAGERKLRLARLARQAKKAVDFARERAEKLARQVEEDTEALLGEIAAEAGIDRMEAEIERAAAERDQDTQERRPA